MPTWIAWWPPSSTSGRRRAPGKSPDTATRLHENIARSPPMHRFANPSRFMRMSAAVLPWLGAVTAALLVGGLILALVVAPPDYQQGDSARIMFIHVPAAWTALFVYVLIVLASASSLIWRHPLADIAGREAAPIGAG